jgi:hypothetical protein
MTQHNHHSSRKNSYWCKSGIDSTGVLDYRRKPGAILKSSDVANGGRMIHLVILSILYNVSDALGYLFRRIVCFF